MRRAAVAFGLAAAMAAFGLAVYAGLGALRTVSAKRAAEPTDVRADVALPGTLYLAQDGALFSLHAGRFSRLTPPAGWMQPAAAPGGDIVAVQRHADYSDLVLLDGHGRVLRQLTADAAPAGGDIGLNHWDFYPHVTTDGSTVISSYDAPKIVGNYKVDLAVWGMPLGASGTPTVQWTTPNGYTGGDVHPVPLASGQVLFARYSLDAQERIVSQLWLTPSPGAGGTALTGAGDDCDQPAVSPDGTQVAMVCTDPATGVQRLGVSSLQGQALGPLRLLAQGGLYTGPVWAPDGSGLAYLSPPPGGGAFQLWWTAGAATVPHAAQEVTRSLALDATSPPAWTG